MENILIKRKSFEVLNQFSETTFKLSFKDKIYFAKKFNDVKNDLKIYVKRLKFLATCGLNVPKVLIVDKKSGFVLTQYIEGKNAFDELVKGELEEDFYKGIFAVAFRSKLERVNINFLPENFVLSSGKLYYMSLDFTNYKEEENFINKYVKLWFYTQEFVNLLKEKNLPIDHSRLQAEYAINKQIVLTTVKYYM